MKKAFSFIVVVACIAIISFFSTNTVSNSKNLAGDPPVVIYPPLKIQGTKSIPVIINIKTLPKTTIRLV